MHIDIIVNIIFQDLVIVDAKCMTSSVVSAWSLIADFLLSRVPVSVYFFIQYHDLLKCTD